MFDRNRSRDARAQAAPRPHHRLDRAGRGVPGRHAHPHRHHEARPSTSSSAKVSSGTDAVVRHEAAYDRGRRAPASAAPRSRPSSSTPSAASTACAAAEGVVSGYALHHRHRRQGRAHHGRRADHGLHACPTDAALRGDVHLLLRPRARHGPHEVAIDATSAREARHPARLARSRSCSAARRRPFTVVGTVGYGDEKDLGGTTSAYFDVRHRAAGARHARRRSTRSTSAPRRRVSDDVARRSASTRSLPKDVEAVTGAAVAKEASDAINDAVRLRQRPVQRSSPASRCSSARSSSGTPSR